MESLLCFTGRRARFINRTDYTQNRFFHLRPIVFLILKPDQRLIKVLQCVFNARVPVGEEPESGNVTLLSSTATVGAALFPNGPMQVAIAKEAT